MEAYETDSAPGTPRPPSAAEPTARAGRRGLPAGGGGSARNHAVGAYGERLAARYLSDRGLVVVDRNWRCPEGELDIVAVEPRPGRRADVARGARAVIFCEVKTRTTTSFGSPVEQITGAKAARLRRLASRWMDEHPSARAARVRIDVIGVLVPARGPVSVRHLEGVA